MSDIKFKHIVAKFQTRPCLICGKNTKIIDILSEAYICCDECYKIFNSIINERED